LKGEGFCIAPPLKEKMQDTELLERMYRGERVITLDSKTRLLSHTILAEPFRNFFIHKVKAPIMKALVKMVDKTIEKREAGVPLEKTPLVKVVVAITKLIPTITEKNTNYRDTHTLLPIIEKFFKYENNAGREDMFHAAFKLLLFEIEHDVYYRDRFNWLLEEIIKAILRGEWEERTNGQPNAPWWKEKGEFAEYGGKYSIMRILQDKKRLEALMGDSWRLQDKNLYR